MPKKQTGPEPHQIIFAGDPLDILLLDPKNPRGAPMRVFVRELPAAYHTLVFRCADRLADLIELCCYVPIGHDERGAKLKTKWPALEEIRRAARFPDVPPAAGYWPVPAGWSDNVKNASQHEIFDLCKKLNFSSAEATGRRLVSAKEWKAPLLLEAEEALLPAVEKLTRSLIGSLSALWSSASPPASASSEKPSPG